MSPSTPMRRLRRSDFSFHGFDDQLPELDAYLDDVGIRTGAPVVATVKNAVYVPAIELSPGHYEGCLVTRDGQPIPTALAQRRYSAFGNQVLGTLSRPLELEINPERVVHEEVVYLGWFVDHFGHILLEALARTWILDQVDRDTRVVFHVEGPPEFTAIALRMLAAFGVPKDRLLFLDTQTVLRRVIVPEALYEISYAAHIRLPDAYRQAASAIVRSGDRSEQPVYLSRRLLSCRHRPIIGELELEEVLRENGFQVAHPELMSFDDQVRLINRHTELFTSAGSAAYLPLFALQPPRIHILTSGIPFHDYFLVPKVLGAEASFCNCFIGDNRPEHYYLPLVLDMDTVVTYLDSLGLLKQRLRSSLTAKARDFSLDHEEQRLFAYVQVSTILGRQLSTEIEAQAVALTPSSWPLCWQLARYYLSHDPTRIDDLIRQFTSLLHAESDVKRLAYFHTAIGRTGQIMRHCSDDTSERLVSVLKDRLMIDIRNQRARQAERRRAKQGAGAKQELGGR